MNNSAILRGKIGVVFGARGSIGAAVAKEFAAAGAEVFLSGRIQSNVEALAKQIKTEGGCVHAAAVDALDDKAVNEYRDRIVEQTGRADIVFNATGPLTKEYGNGKKRWDLTIEEFMVPARTILKSQFITARASARHMLRQHSGVIIFLTGSPAWPRASHNGNRRNFRRH